MIRRCGLVGTLALWVTASGCMGTMGRTGSPLAARPRPWSASSTPPQQQVSLPPERVDEVADAKSPGGISKYFPGLRRDPADAPKVAEAGKPSRSLFGRRSKATQVYATDSRAGLNRGMAEASALPVALQIPGEPATDVAVTPANASTVSEDPKPQSPGVAAEPVNPPDQAPADEAAKPPAAEPTPEPVPAAASQTPKPPTVDPRERPRLTSPPTPSPQLGSQAASAGGPKPAAPTPTAIPGPSHSHAVSCTPEEDQHTCFPHRALSSFRGEKRAHEKHVHATTVLASPQSAPKPSPQVSPTPQAKPSPQASPSPQAVANPAPTVAEAGHGQCSQHFCLRGLVRKACKLDGPDCPHTATAH